MIEVETRPFRRAPIIHLCKRCHALMNYAFQPGIEAGDDPVTDPEVPGFYWVTCRRVGCLVRDYSFSDATYPPANFETAYVLPALLRRAQQNAQHQAKE